MYGGAAGGGKSSALLAAALQYADVEGYSALLLRRTYRELAMNGALMDRAFDWLAPTDAVWHAAEHEWRFPSGATLTFGFLDSENDKYRYQSAEFQFIGVDELTQFTESQYRYMFSRLRRLKSSTIPLRVRSASNPGGVGHDWVKQRMLTEGRKAGRVFIPAKIADNPYLDQVEYVASLMELDPVTRAQLMSGDWSVRASGGMFRRETFGYVEADDLGKPLQVIRAWDMAATEMKPGKDPDWTVGVLMASYEDGTYAVIDVVRFRANPKETEKRIRSTADQDGNRVFVWMEQEPGSSGKIVIDHYRRNVLPGFAFQSYSPDAKKSVRAAPYSSMCDAGLVALVRGQWLTAYLDELESFPEGSHDDQVDASSLAFNQLAAAMPRIRSLG